MLPIVGILCDIRPTFGIDPSAFKETLCRKSFLNKMLRGRADGIQAQRALFAGGTLQNGKVRIEQRTSHGVIIRELVAGTRFEPGADVTCYGGFMERKPPEKEEHTHMRGIPSSDYVLNGIMFSNCFPTKSGAAFDIGPPVSLTPHCDDARWEEVIASSGIGYMANTVTRCPLHRQTRPNVIKCAAAMHRVIPGVSCDSVMVLRACSKGIDIGEAIISPYEGKKSKDKFQFDCEDPVHWAAAGRIDDFPAFEFELVSVDAAQT